MTFWEKQIFFSRRLLQKHHNQEPWHVIVYKPHQFILYISIKEFRLILLFFEISIAIFFFILLQTELPRWVWLFLLVGMFTPKGGIILTTWATV